MVVRSRRQWRGAVLAVLLLVQAALSRVLVWDSKLNTAGNPLFSYTERQMIQACQPIIAAKLAARVQVL